MMLRPVVVWRGAHVCVEVGDCLRHGLDLSAAKVSVLPRHRSVGDRLLVDVVIRGGIGLRLRQVQADRLLIRPDRADERRRDGCNGAFIMSIGAALAK